MSKIHVGQKLYLVYTDSRRGTDCEVTVTKVGRKYAELDIPRFRIFVDTMNVDGRGYSSPGRCFLSREEYEKNVGLQRKWQDFKNAVGRKQLEGITHEDISRAAAALGLIGFVK